MDRTPQPDEPMRSVHTVCLIKDCTGRTVDVRGWGRNVILLRTHEHGPRPRRSPAHDTPRREDPPPCECASPTEPER